MSAQQIESKDSEEQDAPAQEASSTTTTTEIIKATTTTTAPVVVVPSSYGGVPWAWIKAVNDVVENEPWEPPNHACLPIQLLPWLWLSDQLHVVQDVYALRKLGITHVLSTNAMYAYELDNIRTKLQAVGIQHAHVRGRDEERYDMIGKHWEECHTVLQQVQQQQQQSNHNNNDDGAANNAQIVVHCVAGTNRSGLIACAAVMLFERWSVLDVVKFCKEKRGMLLTNRSFQRQLCQLAAKEGLLGPKPEGYTDEPLLADMIAPPPPPLATSVKKLEMFNRKELL